VVAFATLTPTLRAVGTTAQDEAASPTVAASLAPPTVPVIATATSLPTPTGISSHSATPAAPSTSSDGISYTWLLPFAGVVAIGAFLIWRNGKNVKRSM
jgi:hypothetical protein